MRRLCLGLLLFPVLSALPAHAVDQTRRFVVFFTEWSAAIDKPAQAVVRDAAQWIEAHPAAQVTVTGAADLTGSRKANLLLSALRAQVVTDLLARDGVPEGRVKQEGLGSVGYSLTAQESRRVIIAVAP
jgi:outer membrane protein OmpA-like peptidoglycan-associated protein